jgi:methionine sulfoxide reductase heme-binding subunit
VNELLWYLSRSTGIASVILLTATFVLGALTTGRAAPVGVPTWVRASLHRTLSLILIVFVAVHVVTAIVETYVDIGWISAVVPFSSTYDPAWVGLGTLAFDLLLVVLITSALRHRIPTRTWRLVHLSAYAMWPLALAHGLGSSTSDRTVMLVVTVICTLVGATAVVYRLTHAVADTSQRKLTHAQAWR